MMAGGKFYNWCMRLLLERVTEWAADWQMANIGGLEPLRIVFAQRGHDWNHFLAYVDLLEMQSRNGTLFLKGKGLAPTLLDRGVWSIEPAAGNAGLQLADTVASAFYQGANHVAPNYDIEPAKALSPVLQRRNGIAAHNSVTLFPLPHQAKVPAGAHPLFEFFDYKFSG